MIFPIFKNPGFRWEVAAAKAALWEFATVHETGVSERKNLSRWGGVRADVGPRKKRRFTELCSQFKDSSERETHTSNKSSCEHEAHNSTGVVSSMLTSVLKVKRRAHTCFCFVLRLAR